MTQRSFTITKEFASACAEYIVSIGEAAKDAGELRISGPDLKALKSLYSDLCKCETTPEAGE